MDIEPEQMKKLIETFGVELEEKLQDITDGLLRLEKIGIHHPDAQKNIEVIFRAAHNIKGAARSIGISNVGEIAHYVESLFTNIQVKKVACSPEIINLCLETVDDMRLAMKAYLNKSPLEFDLPALLERLQLQTSKTDKNNGKIVNPTTPMRSPMSSMQNPPTPKTQLDISLQSTASLEKLKGDSIRVPIKNLDHISALAEDVQMNKIAIDEHYKELNNLRNKIRHLHELWHSLNPTFERFNKEAHETRVLQQCQDEILELGQTAQNLEKNMHLRINELTNLSNALQDELRTLRLLPASIILRPLSRTVRDIALELKKNVDFEVSGDSVKMDKMILEVIQNPLIHLVRNAIDHGIESPEVRTKKNKPPEGQLRISVQELGDQILIKIMDDGAGINPQHIAAMAVKKNILTAKDAENMTEKDALTLLFHPGFSTKEIITDVSGRGIGLDIVKTELARVKGQVTVESRIDKGTTFNIYLPLTLSSERGLIVKSSDQLFVLPTTLIERVVSIHTRDIVDVENSQAIVINEQSIPLRVLSELINLPNKKIAKEDELAIIILQKNTQKIALLVEQVLNEREIVIKPLHPPLQNIPCVIGGTLSGDGQVIIVLDTNDIISLALQNKLFTRVTTEENVDIEKTRAKILVVDDSITTRTLEKNILENSNFNVTTAVNGKEAWDLLQHEQFSLLITDITMPIMDGFTLTEKVKHSKELQDMPVIIVTSLGSDAEKQRGINVGANAYIVKNEFESEKLLEIVEQLV